MERWTIKQLNSLSDLRFAQAILNERLNRLTQPYSPLASKLRDAVATLSRLADEEESKSIAEPPKKQYLSYEEVFEDLGWTVHKNENDGALDINQHSPCGEDFWFSIEGENIPQEVSEYAEDFDVDEHVDLWAESRGKRGVPESYHELVEDAEAIKAMLIKLAEALDSVQDNCELGTYDCSTCVLHGRCDREEDGEGEDDE